MKIIDISSNGDYPANELSNFYPHPFVFDGIECASMEGFLQSLKYRNAKKQREVCLLSGREAKEAGKHKFFWKLTGNIWWKTEKIARTGARFSELLTGAYNSLSENKGFADALRSAKGCILVHSIGKSDPRKTILTEEEFISRLYLIMENL